MYEIYQTEAFVFKSTVKKEQDEKVLLFTKDFGLIFATVSSSKKDSSRHKNLTQELSFVRVFLVLSKNGFRITGGEFLDNIYFSAKKIKKEKIQIIKNIFILLEKIFIKNHRDEYVFELLKNIYTEIIFKKKEDEIKKIELVFLVDLFVYMGYIDKKEFSELDNLFGKKFEDTVRKLNGYIKKAVF